MSALDAGIKTNWGITYEIPAFKKVNIDDKYLPYSHFPVEQQKWLLQNHFVKGCRTELIGYNTDDIYFEYHKDGRAHMHTILRNIDYDDVYRLQQYICRDILHLRPKQYQQVFNFFKPDDFMSWLNYIRKDVSNIDILERDLKECID